MPVSELIILFMSKVAWNKRSGTVCLLAVVEMKEV